LEGDAFIDSEDLPESQLEFCEPIEQQQTTFAGLKSFKFDKQTWIKESGSRDYQKIFNLTMNIQNNRYSQGINQRQMQQIMPRVGFLNNIVYMVNNDFTHFIDKNDEFGGAFLDFDSILDGDPVQCEDLEADQCDFTPWCTAQRGSPDCDWDVCIEIAVYQWCVSE